MPVDRDPVPDGNIRLSTNNGQVFAEVLAREADRSMARLAGTPLHKNHFATCPAAAAFRKPKVHAAD